MLQLFYLYTGLLFMRQFNVNKYIITVAKKMIYIYIYICISVKIIAMHLRHGDRFYCRRRSCNSSESSSAAL